MSGCRFSQKTRRCSRHKKAHGNDLNCRSKRKHSGKRVCVKTVAATDRFPKELARGMIPFKPMWSPASNYNKLKKYKSKISSPRSAARATAAREKGLKIRRKKSQIRKLSARGRTSPRKKQKPSRKTGPPRRR